MLQTDTHVFFYGNKDPFSNFFKTRFTYDGLPFESSEQCFMYMKAKLFRDDAMASRIAAETAPAAAKALGRKVRGFQEAVWLGHRKRLMHVAVFSKFSQDHNLAMQLLLTGGKQLVEASPRDRIWGVGMAQSDPAIMDPKNWKGLNLLGQVLCDVRHELLQAAAYQRAEMQRVAERQRALAYPSDPSPSPSPSEHLLSEPGPQPETSSPSNGSETAEKPEPKKRPL